MFTKEYVNTILAPFVGKTFRMRTENEDKTFSIPFCLETSMESTFQIEFTNLGIKFLLIDNFYVKKNIETALNKAFIEVGIYPLSLDRLLKEEPPKGEDCVVMKKVREYLQKAITPQIAFTYYTMIKSLKVSENYFVLNGIKFVVYK